MRNESIVWLRLVVLALGLGLASPAALAASYPPQKMTPTPPEKLQLIGSTDGMVPFPCKPLPGYPGMDPDPAKGRLPRNTPMMMQNYPGSVEMYMPNNGYLPKANPWNYRTLVKNFVAVDLPDVPGALKEEFTPPQQYLKPGGGQWDEIVRTGDTLPPASVVRLKPGGQHLKFALDPLPTSTYIVRVIGALQTEDVLPYPKNLIVEMDINDGPNGEVSRYVMRHRGTDNFYPVGEFFFHVVDNRPWQIDISLHPDSQIDLLVHNIDVHDVLAECAKRAGKTDSITAPLDTLAKNWGVDPATKLKPLRQGAWTDLYDQQGVDQRVADLGKEFPGKNNEELLKIWRQRRDDAIWYNGAPMNVNLMGDEWGGLPIGVSANYSKTDPKTEAEWVKAGVLPENHKNPDDLDTKPWTVLPAGWRLANDMGPWRMVRTLPDGAEQTYTREDLLVGKPLPGLPVDVPPWGKRFEGEGGTAYFLSPQVQALGSALRAPNIREEAYVRNGNLEAGRDAALRLVRFAYDFPSIEPTHYLSRLCPPTIYAHQRWYRFYQYLDLPLPSEYDRLYTVVKDNQELADAVHRYIPWVETPQDVLTLLDTYAIQYSVAKFTYWRQGWYDHGNAGALGEMVAMQMDPQIVKPWVEIIFTRTWEYPLPPAGIQDYIYASIQQDGTTNIGSSYYTQPGASAVARWLDVYVKNGGDPKYSLSDARLYPRATAANGMGYERNVAGQQHLAVGDVGGYYRGYNEYAKGSLEQCMSSRSRTLANWGGILEDGTESNDFRFRQAARVRVGWGTGHDHADTLDLGLWALGMPISICGGARGGYGYPSTGASISHNVVTVEGQNIRANAWVPDLADLDNVQYMKAKARYQQEFSRQVALIETDPGKPTPYVYGKDADGKYDNNIVFPKAYLVDFSRVIGGKRQEYNFHGFPDDEFVSNVQPSPLNDEEQQFLRGYVMKGEQWGGTVTGDDMQATWRMDRKGKTFVCPAHPERVYEAMRPEGSKIFQGVEPWIMREAYDPNSPRKYVRLHLLGEKDQRMLTGELIIAPYGVGRNDGEYQRQVHVLRHGAGEPLSSLFAAVWEPYAGEPFIKTARLEGNPNDAMSAAAVHIDMVNGQQDVCFADATAKDVHRLDDGTEVQASFAYVSHDAQGLRQACVVGGKLLKTPEVTIAPARSEWRAAVKDVNYLDRIVTLDQALPALLAGSFFEVGSPAQNGHEEHFTTFKAMEVAPKAEQTAITWRYGADVFAGKVAAVTPDAAQPGVVIVKTELAPILIPGENTQLIMTTEARDRFWRCDVETKDDYRGQNAVGGAIRVYDPNFKADNIKAGERICLYSFGPGDAWRLPTKVAVRRVNQGIYHVVTNVPCEVSVQGASAFWSTDGTTWHQLQAGADGKLVWQITDKELGQANLILRVEMAKQTP